MANSMGAFIGTRNYADQSGVVYATEAGSVGERLVSNLASTRSDDVWRFLVGALGTTGECTVTLPADATIALVSVQFPRGTYPGVSEASPAFGPTDLLRVRLRGADDAVLWDSGAVQGVQPGYGVWWARPPAPVAGVRSALFSFVAASRATAGFCDVASVGLWDLFEPRVGASYPAGFGWLPNIESERTPAGRLYTSRYEPMRRWSLDLEWLSNAESLTLDELNRRSGGALPVFVRRGDLPAGKDAMHALLTVNRLTESITPELRSVSATFDEFI